MRKQNVIIEERTSDTRPGLFFCADFAAKLQDICDTAPARKTAKSRILSAR